MKYSKWFTGLLGIFLAGCSIISTPEPSLTPSCTPTDTPLAPTSTPTATASATPVPLIEDASSPLQGIAGEDLKLITSYPYSVKYPFSEGPEGDKNHPAIDLGFYHTTGIPSYTGPQLDTDDGFPIQAILPGKVVETVNDLFPYGNMVLIETPLSLLSSGLLAKLAIPEPYSSDEMEVRFPCDKNQPAIVWSESSRSLYTLYAHMKEPSSLTTGDQVESGEIIGAIGATGNTSASIEHLHLEVRVGPSEAKFGTISAYSATSSDEERYNYCIWALSEEFQSIDPARFWSTDQGGD